MKNKKPEMKNEKRELDCNTWFEKDRNGNRQFIPYLCAQDYCSIYNVTTGYTNKYPSEFFKEIWIDDATNLIKQRLELTAEGRITHIDMDEAIECIANISRITDPKMINLTPKEYIYNEAKTWLIPPGPYHYDDDDPETIRRMLSLARWFGRQTLKEIGFNISKLPPPD